MGSSSHLYRGKKHGDLTIKFCNEHVLTKIIFDYTNKIKAMQIESTNISGFHPFEKKKNTGQKTKQNWE